MSEASAVFLRDMAVVMVLGAVATLLFLRLRQPVVLGYILAGVVLGPHTPPVQLVRESGTIAILGELGIVFLLFALGLEFNFRKLRRVGVGAVLAGALQTVLMVWIGYVVGLAFGFERLEALFLGAIISISSTVIIVKILAEMKQMDEGWAQLVLGILIVEDILAVLLLALLGTAGSGDLSLAATGVTLVKLLAFVGTAIVVGLVVVPRLVGRVARTPVPEVLVIVVLALAFGMAVLAQELGFSIALGAFIAGALIAESRAAHEVRDRVAPLKDVFTAIFFVAVGMLIDPAALIHYWPLVLAVTAAVIVGKVAAVTFGAFVAGHAPSTALRAGFGLAQIGEFSFILAALGVSMGIAKAPLYEVAVSVAALTAFTTPLLIRIAPRAVSLAGRIAPRPLATYASLYGTWVARLARSDPEVRRATNAGIRAGLLGVVFLTLASAGLASLGMVDSVLAARFPDAASFTRLAGWLAIGAVALPFGVLFLRSLRAFGDALAAAALPARLHGTSQAAAVRAVLRRTFVLGGLVVLATPLLALWSPLAPPWPVVALVAVVLVASGGLLLESTARFQRSVDEALAPLIPSGDERRDGVYSVMREQYPWGAGAHEIVVPESSALAHRSLREARLRSETGATVVGVRRGAELLDPAPDLVVRPGDTLVVMGESDQVAAAERLAMRAPDATAATGQEARYGEVVVGPDSPLADVTLAESRYRERTGELVLAVLRGDERIPHPPPDFRILPGDVLLVVGRKET